MWMILENMNSEVLFESCHKTDQGKKGGKKKALAQPSPQQHHRAKVTVLLTGNRKGFSKHLCLVCQHRRGILL